MKTGENARGSRLAVIAALLGALAAGCGGADATLPAPAAPVPEPPPTPASPPPALATPEVVIDAPNVATVRGSTSVAFDGIEEGLAWPALEKALSPLGSSVTLRVARGVPTLQVLRAVWTLRQATVHIQSQDEAGVMQVVDLMPQPSAPGKGCHAAVFLRPDGSIRIALPGGPVVLDANDAAASLARSFEAARASCPLRYVAFGMESDSSPWGPLFDVLRAVDARKAAGEARYVLGQAMHVAAQ